MFDGYFTYLMNLNFRVSMVFMLKHTNYLISALLTITVVAFPQAQTIDEHLINQSSIEEQQKIYQIPGSHLLREKVQSIQKYLKKFPAARSLTRQSEVAWNFSISDVHDID